jgi:hypothetical protein
MNVQKLFSSSRVFSSSFQETRSQHPTTTTTSPHLPQPVHSAVLGDNTRFTQTNPIKNRLLDECT